MTVFEDNAHSFYANKGMELPKTFYFIQIDIDNSDMNIKVKNMPNSFQIL